MGKEVFGVFWWIIFVVFIDIFTTDFFYGYVFDVEVNIVIRDSFWERFVVYFYRFYFSGDVGWSKGDNYIWFDNISFYFINWYCFNIYFEKKIIFKFEGKNIIRIKLLLYLFVVFWCIVIFNLFLIL